MPNLENLWQENLKFVFANISENNKAIINIAR
jgi:hypothetical protein